jgi:hypothetical protein
VTWKFYDHTSYRKLMKEAGNEGRDDSEEDIMEELNNRNR